MTIRSLTRAEIRSLDEQAANELGLPTLVLMENAGRGAAERLRAQISRPGRILIACGPGNNGGDGGVVARHLDAWGYSVRVVWFARADRIVGDAAVQKRILERSGVDQQTWEREPGTTAIEALCQDAEWIVDGLLGTGLTRPVEGYLRTVIEALNSSGKPVLALDLPSGLDADTGQPQGVAVRARLTVTFVAPKLGFGQPGADGYTGRVEVVEIGLPRQLLEPFETG
jgi:NAD(P)H-hydrate epimerase